ncbi:hypothetical protein GCM10025762_41850 [Haloechinothrix salitolerans]
MPEEYTCEITWNVTADSPREAAESTWNHIKESDGPVVEVFRNGSSVYVDLSQDADDAATTAQSPQWTRRRPPRPDGCRS